MAGLDALSILPFDPIVTFDPFTLGALIGIAVWLDRRLRNVEKSVAYNTGFIKGQESEREVNQKK